MDRWEALWEALKAVDADEVADKIALVGELLDEGISVLTMIAAATPTQKDDSIVKILKTFNYAFQPLVTKTAQFVDDMSEENDQ